MDEGPRWLHDSWDAKRQTRTWIQQFVQNKFNLGNFTVVMLNLSAEVFFFVDDGDQIILASTLINFVGLRVREIKIV